MSKQKRYAEEEKLINIAEKIAASANAKDENFGFDPFTIIAIINIIIGITRIIIECRKNRDTAFATVRKPGIFARFMLKREIRKNFPPNKRKCVYDAIIAVAPSLSNEELEDGFSLVEKELNKK